MNMHEVTNKLINDIQKYEDAYVKNAIADSIKNETGEVVHALVIYTLDKGNRIEKHEEVTTLESKQVMYHDYIPYKSEGQKYELNKMLGSNPFSIFGYTLYDVKVIYPEQLTDIRNNPEKYEMEDYL